MIVLRRRFLKMKRSVRLIKTSYKNYRRFKKIKDEAIKERDAYYLLMLEKHMKGVSDH